MKIFIPFDGFYESFFGAELDQEIERACDTSDPENENPLDLDDIYKRADWSKAHEYISREYVAAFSREFNSEFGDEIGLNLALEFSELISPREYNFETDRIKCEISDETARALFSKVSQGSLANMIKERHSSCDGFYSFYSDNLQDWINKPVTDYDANELETVLLTLIDELSARPDSWRYSELILERISCNGEFAQALDLALAES